MYASIHIDIPQFFPSSICHSFYPSISFTLLFFHTFFHAFFYVLTIAVDGVDDLLPFLLEEFPYLHLAPETLHSMWKKSAKQIQLLAQSEQDLRAKKSKAVMQVSRCSTDIREGLTNV